MQLMENGNENPGTAMYYMIVHLSMKLVLWNFSYIGQLLIQENNSDH